MSREKFNLKEERIIFTDKIEEYTYVCQEIKKYKVI